MLPTTRFLLTIGLLLTLAAATAPAEPVSFSVTTGTGARTATDNAIVKNGITYVHLGALISQVGGGVSVTQDRAQIDLAEKSAWLRDNNPQVSASLGIFQLTAPIMKEGNDVLIAVSDVKPFFEKAFRIAANQQVQLAAAAAAPAPAPTVAPAPAAAPAGEEALPELDPVPLKPAAPPAQPATPANGEVLLEPVAPVAPATPDAAPAQVPGPAPVPAPAAPAPEGAAPVAAPAEGTAPAPNAAEPGMDLAKATDPAAAVSRPVNRTIETIIIDPGHGGSDLGAQGPKGVRECNVTLALAEKLRKAIEQGSALKTVLTRDKDVPVGAAQRAILANSNKGDLIISLHTGGAFKPETKGCRVFICGADSKFAAGPYAEQDKTLAQAVATAVQQGTGSTFGGIYQMSCSVMKDAGMPGFMIELGMLTNPEEEAMLAGDEYQSKLAAAIAAGIKSYIDSAKTGSAQ